MGFFHGVIFYASVAGVGYMGLNATVPNESLVGAIIPLLLLWIMIDVPHFLTLGTIDLGTAFAMIRTKPRVSSPDKYSAMVLPIDTDDSGMMKQDRYVRHCEYALRKLWLKNGLERELKGADYKLEVLARSLKIVEPLGLLSGYSIQSSVVAVRDEQDALFLEQRLTTGSASKLVAKCFVKFRVKDRSEYLRRPGAEKLPVSKVLAHVLTRKLLGGNKRRSLGAKARPDPKQAQAEAVVRDLAVLCDGAGKGKVARVDLERFIAFTSGPVQKAAGQVPGHVPGVAAGETKKN